MYTTLKIISRKFLEVSLIWTFFSHVGAIFYETAHLRNKSWKPECVGSFNMGWKILIFYPEPLRGIKFTYIRQPMLKLKTHSSFHDLFRF
jgi:hypothetical protein